MVARSEKVFEKERQLMVENQIRARGISNPRVLNAFNRVPRENFVPAEIILSSYADQAISIGLEQTISQPYVAAYMTEALQIKESDRILEIGTGSGYQTAILAELASDVYTIERIDRLGLSARNHLTRMGYKNIHFRIGDGYKGWPEHSPFDKIIITAAPTRIPEELLQQLDINGRLIGPYGLSEGQRLVLLEKTSSGIEKSDLFPVRFVPMLSGFAD